MEQKSLHNNFIISTEGRLWVSSRVVEELKELLMLSPAVDGCCEVLNQFPPIKTVILCTTDIIILHKEDGGILFFAKGAEKHSEYDKKIIQARLDGLFLFEDGTLSEFNNESFRGIKHLFDLQHGTVAVTKNKLMLFEGNNITDIQMHNFLTVINHIGITPNQIVHISSNDDKKLVLTPYRTPFYVKSAVDVLTGQYLVALDYEGYLYVKPYGKYKFATCNFLKKKSQFYRINIKDDFNEIRIQSNRIFFETNDKKYFSLDISVGDNFTLQFNGFKELVLPCTIKVQENIKL